MLLEQGNCDSFRARKHKNELWNGCFRETIQKVGAGIYIVVIQGDKIDKKFKMIVQK